VKICRRYRFSASHQLMLMPEEHKCRRMHGHNYMVEVMVRAAEVDDRFMVMDFAELDDLVAPLIHTVDHHHLNDILSCDQPTAEFIAAWMYQELIDDNRGQYKFSVRVWETENCYAEYP
jgi:6-pyruvoyltetrahydropterin/6-carboxytetrahydropterin synthase